MCVNSQNELKTKQSKALAEYRRVWMGEGKEVSLLAFPPEPFLTGEWASAFMCRPCLRHAFSLCILQNEQSVT